MPTREGGVSRPLKMEVTLLIVAVATKLIEMRIFEHCRSFLHGKSCNLLEQQKVLMRFSLEKQIFHFPSN